MILITYVIKAMVINIMINVHLFIIYEYLCKRENQNAHANNKMLYHERCDRCMGGSVYQELYYQIKLQERENIVRNEERREQQCI
ncbi:hypothetical protein CRG92_00230 [Escherichia sp. E2586]|nr:hypothetical protein CRG92_00230 [Escherichia sp. E2586]